MTDTQPINLMKEPEKTRVHVTRVKEANRAAVQEGATYLSLYYNRPASVLTTSQGGDIIGFDGLKDLGFNVLAEAIRAGKSQIVQPLQPRVTPIGGTWETLRACEGLSQVIDGVFEMCDFTGLVEQMVIDGACCGEGYGIIDVDPIKKDFSAARLDPLETFYNSDRTEAVTTRMISRRRLRAWYPEHAAVIDSLPRYTPDVVVQVDAQGSLDAEDNVALYCWWAEAIGDEKGWHTIQLADRDGTLLVNREWKGPLPIFSFQWDHGHRGQNDAKPLGRTIAPMHYWLNQMVRKMHDAVHGIVPTVIGETDPKWSDVPYQFIKVKPGETPPKVVYPESLSPAIRQVIVDLREQVYRETGLSEEAAAGSAPPQFKSGVALSTWKKIINEALSQQHRNHDGVWNQGARIIVYQAPEVYKTKKARAAARGTDVIQQIDFGAVSLPEDVISVSFDAVSDLPRHIPQKLELLGYLEEKGGIDTAQLMLYMDLADFRGVAKRMNGPRALIEAQISKALNEGDLLPPSEMQDHAKLAELAGQAYQAAQAQYIRPPAKNMQALLHLYLLAKARTQGAATAPSGAPAPAPGLAPTLTPTEAPPLAPGVTAPPAAPLPIV